MAVLKLRSLALHFTVKSIDAFENGENSVVLAGKTIDEITLQDVFEAIAKEDLLAIELVEEIASQLGLHVAAIIQCLQS